MNKIKSVQRRIKRGKAKVEFNETLMTYDTFRLSKRGKWLIEARSEQII